MLEITLGLDLLFFFFVFFFFGCSYVEKQRGANGFSSFSEELEYIVGSSGCGSLHSLSSFQFRVHLPVCCEEVSSFAFCLGVHQIFSMRYEG